MNKRPLGNTGMQVSEIAFGGVEIGMPYGIGVDSDKDMIAEHDALRLLHASLEAGINFYDTARQHGKSESLIGKAFGDRREQVIICTKSLHSPAPSTFSDGVLWDGLSKEPRNRW